MKTSCRRLPLLFCINLLLLPFFQEIYALDETRVPDPPKNVVWSATSDSVDLNWDPPDNANSVMVRGYVVGYGIGSPDTAGTMAINGLFSTKFTLQPLEPDTEYAVSITAFNDVGDSPQFVTFVRTLQSEHSRGEIFGPFPPLNMLAEAKSSSEMHVTWEDQDKKEGNRYTVKYAPVDNHNMEDYAKLESKDEYVNIMGLNPNTQYEFSVKVHSEEGDSTWSIPRLASTLPDVPYSAPYGFKLISTSGDSVKIAWKPPKEPNGQMIGYELYYTVGLDLPELEDWIMVELPAAQHSYSLKGLSPGTLFVKMRAVNEVGKGPISPPAIHSVEALTPDSQELITHKYIQSQPALWISPGASEIEKESGKYLTMVCETKKKRRVSDLRWTYPNGSKVQSSHHNDRVYTNWSSDRLRLVFVQLKYSDSGVFSCEAVIDGTPIRKHFVLKVLPSNVESGESENSEYCDFEQSNVCGWSPDPLQRLTWGWVEAGIFTQGLTMLLPRDHTTANGRTTKQAGHYMYMEGQQEQAGSARLLSPTYRSGFSFHSCFSFWYYSTGESKGLLSVYVVPSDEIYSKFFKPLMTIDVEDTKGQWVEARVNLKPVKNDFRIIIDASKERGKPLMLALDDVNLDSSLCNDKAEQGDTGINKRELHATYVHYMHSNK